GLVVALGGWCVLGPAQSAMASTITIINDDFYTGFTSSQSNAGTTPNMADLPSATWQDAVTAGQYVSEHDYGGAHLQMSYPANIAISIMSGGSYVEPSELTVSAIVVPKELPNMVLGYYSSPPTDPTAQTTDFTGMAIDDYTGNLQLYSNGTAVGGVVDYTGTGANAWAFNGSAFTLTYTIDTSTGTVTGLTFGATGQTPVSYPDTDWGTVANSLADYSYLGMGSYGGGVNGGNSNFANGITLTSNAVPEPAMLSLLALGGPLLLSRRNHSRRAGRRVD
ncbi:MAG TPA: PEP-CTERM sorting domain-containing protein, partial [Tepidisphaeraceae bacterium]|nr:PEP-CTERM sorting domain-containing protein [Tepidisphaeraceae bacterium]